MPTFPGCKYLTDVFDGILPLDVSLVSDPSRTWGGTEGGSGVGTFRGELKEVPRPGRRFGRVEKTSL